MYITMPFMSKLWCHNAAKESTCDLWTWASESQRAKAAGFKPTEDCLAYFNDVSSLKAVELKKLCTIHGIDETYPKKKCNPPDFKFYPSQLTDENFPHMV